MSLQVTETGDKRHPNGPPGSNADFNLTIGLKNGIDFSTSECFASWLVFSFAEDMYFLFYFLRDGSGPNCEISREVGLAVCEAFVEADKVRDHL